MLALHKASPLQSAHACEEGEYSSRLLKEIILNQNTKS
jgi:hypothetical protein